MISQNELVDRIKSYNPALDPSVVEGAYEYAKKMHDGQKRESGEPYYTHPVEVANILAEMKMDVGTIVTAILHDTLEDTEATYEEIRRGGRGSREWRQQADPHRKPDARGQAG